MTRHARRRHRTLVVVVTATLSGIFGMAGGMILMAFLTFTYSVGAAMMLHGVTQAVSNGYRAVINRSDIVWRLDCDQYGRVARRARAFSRS